MAKPLESQVAIVAGATRGAGRGIARGLGEAGAFVYCTGRSMRGNPSPYKRPETLEETAEMIVAAGGTAVAERVDHTVEAEIEALLARVREKQGRLDILVNCVAGEDPLLGSWDPIWKTDFTNVDRVLRQVLTSHLMTVKHAMQLMMERKRGLIFEVTDGDLLMSGGGTFGALAKQTHKMLAQAWAAEFHQHGVAVLSITPGFLRSEKMLENFKVTETNWRDAGKEDKNFLESESPLFVGRAVAALAADPNILDRTGEMVSSWEIGREFGLTDYDGRRPDWGKLDIDYSMFDNKFLQEYADTFAIQARWLRKLSARIEERQATFLKNEFVRARVR
jgi:NAD(P)-dependent dehydrogenase (short-subunit alcohol dehydrogenase family)